MTGSMNPEQFEGLLQVLGEELRTELDRHLKDRGDHACEEIDTLVASVLRQLPPAWRALPARQAFRILLGDSAGATAAGRASLARVREVDAATQTEEAALGLSGGAWQLLAAASSVGAGADRASASAGGAAQAELLRVPASPREAPRLQASPAGALVGGAASSALVGGAASSESPRGLSAVAVAMPRAASPRLGSGYPGAAAAAVPARLAGAQHPAGAGRAVTAPPPSRPSAPTGLGAGGAPCASLRSRPPTSSGTPAMGPRGSVLAASGGQHAGAAAGAGAVANKPSARGAAQKWPRSRGDATRQQADMEARLRAAEDNISRTERLHRELTDSLQRWEGLSEEEREAKLRWIHTNAEDILNTRTSGGLAMPAGGSLGGLHNGRLHGNGGATLSESAHGGAAVVAAGGPAGGA